MRSETLHALLPVVIFAGLAFSLFAAAESLIPSLQSACSVNSYISCHRVDASPFTKTLGIPDYVIGIGGFLLLFGLDVQVYRLGRGRWLDALIVVSAIGFLFSLYFGYLELAVIKALCVICFGAYLCNVGTLTTALLLRRPSREAGGAPPAAPATDGS